VTNAVLSLLKPRAKDLFAPAKKIAKQLGDQAAGCGALLRVMPVGLLRRVLFKELIVDTIQVCRLTHFDQRCVDAAIAYNFGISYLTSGKDPSKLLFKTWRFVADARDSREYRELVGSDLPAEDMVKALRAVNSLQYEDLKSDGRAIHAAQAAYWIVLNAIDFEEGLVRAVNLGGDAATLGAIAGAFLGARFGEHAIPERWLNQLEQRGEFHEIAKKLCVLAEPKK
jgi:ADP-ribosyl-[dinitrogen reductase] hydrolase